METMFASLIEDHTRLLARFSAVRDAGFGTPAGNAAMVDAREALEACWMREEDELFPALERKPLDESLRIRARRSAEQLKLLRAQTQAFFQRFPEGGEGLEFAREFGRLMGVLQSRVRTDETLLYAPLQRAA